MRNFESFRTEQELINRINQLREQGVNDKEMYVVSSERSEGEFEYADINRDSDVSFGDRVGAFFTGQNPEEKAFDRFNFDETTKREAVAAVKNGAYVLVIDRDGFFEDDNYAATGRLDYVDEDIRTRTDLDDRDKIRLHEERLRVDKDRVESGSVNVHTDVITERKEIEVPVEREEVTIERRKVDEAATGSFDDTLNDSDTIRVPLHEERVTVSKDNVVTEEIVIKKNVVQGTETVGADVRKETVRVEEDGRNIEEVNRNVETSIERNDKTLGDKLDEVGQNLKNKADRNNDGEVSLDDVKKRR